MSGVERVGNYQIVHGSTGQLAVARKFIESLDNLQSDGGSRQASIRGQIATPPPSSFFNSDAELVIARAPGRLDVMGGIADYSGSLVLEWPIAEATFVALQRDDSRSLRVLSLSNESERELLFEMPLAELENGGAPLDYETARRYFRDSDARHWAAYVVGVFLVLMREKRVRFQNGARLLISSEVPEGKGVSSSAALEVATMSAVAAAFSIDLQPRELALLSQRVENGVVGAPCGVMDQMTSECGEQGQLLELLCQPAEIIGSIRLPEELALWGLDSGVRHSVSGADYGSVRVGTFIGYRMIAEFAGLSIKTTERIVAIDDPRWRGYLANLAVSEFEERYRRRLPENISGADFLSRYGATTDSVTPIDVEKNYAVRIPTVHAVYESFRVRTFSELLRSAGMGEQRLSVLGELMYQSHASYSACGLGSAGTDALVKLVKAEGENRGLYGAKITGGGSGGTVVVLGRRDSHKAIESVAERYFQETGHKPYIFQGSSPGSASFGYLKVRRAA